MASLGILHAQEAELLRVLLIGNSISYWNDLPAWVTQLSAWRT
jgi:hypothetical protein